MANLVAASVIVFFATVFAVGSAFAQIGPCDAETSTPQECWHNCKTEDDIKICDILTCPEGIGCSFDFDETELVITIRNSDAGGPHVGHEVTKYVDGKQAKGRVSTRIHQTIGVDSSDKSDLRIVLTPRK